MAKGKNYSCNNTGKRKKSDFYETPYSITEHLLNNEKFLFDSTVLEPAAGDGAIVKVISKKIKKTISTDLKSGIDFLKVKKDLYNPDYIITNPPFSIAYEFVLQAKKICKNKFAFLLPLSYLHGKKRFDNIYKDKKFPLARVYVFTRYPMLGDELRIDGKYKTGMMVYAWFIWDRFYKGEPIIKWIDNNDDVLKRSDLI